MSKDNSPNPKPRNIKKFVNKLLAFGLYKSVFLGTIYIHIIKKLYAKQKYKKKYCDNIINVALLSEKNFTREIYL